jgi:putative membrane protein
LDLLIATYRRFRFSNLAYVLIFIHACILVIGGHYTYAEAPIGYWMQEWFGFGRNN